MTARAFIAVALLPFTLAVAKKDRDWKAGVLQQTAHSDGVVPGARTIVLGGGAPVYGNNPYPAAAAASGANAAAVAAAQSHAVHLQGYRIEGNGYRFIVSVDVTRGNPPNVTVHGPIKYALENGTFYLLDEDGKEFKATVLEKALLVPDPPPAAAAAPTDPTPPKL